MAGKFKATYRSSTAAHQQCSECSFTSATGQNHAPTQHCVQCMATPCLMPCIAFAPKSSWNGKAAAELLGSRTHHDYHVTSAVRSSRLCRCPIRLTEITACPAKQRCSFQHTCQNEEWKLSRRFACPIMICAADQNPCPTCFKGANQPCMEIDIPTSGFTNLLNHHSQPDHGRSCLWS